MPTKYLSHFIIKIDGADVSEKFMDDLDQVVVDTSLYMPDLFTIRLRDKKLEWVDDSLLDIGKQVEISVEQGSEEGGLTGVLIQGEITALEPHFSATEPTKMVVRGYDKSHRLHRGRQTRTFLQTQDSALASKIAGEAGLQAQVDSTTVTYDHVIQYNQTNMEFLMTRAERIGYQVFASEGKLYFKKADFSLGETELKYGESLRSFHPSWTASHQADKMIVKGWNPKDKEAITAEKTPNASLNQGGMSGPGGNKVQSAISSAEEIIVEKPVFTPSEATALAQGLSDDISREYVQAEGVCIGHPLVKAGYKVNIKDVGDRFSGKYFVTSATHIYSAQGYETRFSISGRHPNTLSHLLDSGDGHGAARGLVQGVVPALVTNFEDPDNLGRVKVKYAWLGEVESDWLRIASPMAGSGRGFQYLPEINDEVLIAFEHGDVHRPYLLGTLWNSKDKPPSTNSEVASGGVVNQRILKTRAGHLIVLDDAKDAEQVSITSKSGHKVILDDKKNSEKITISDKTGKNKMVIDSKNNSMSIDVMGDFSVTAKGKITLSSTQDMSLEAKTNAKFKGLQLALEGTTKSELKGAQVSVNGSAQTELKGGVAVTIQGAIVKIN